jgi:hypothetical protein
VFDDKVLVEAYPIVAGYAPFEALANSDKYILFDPAAGLNKFSITGNTFADPFLSRQTAGVDFSVGVSFMQNFRKTTDGVVFEQVFTGQGIIDDGVNPAFTYRASGTLGVGLRRYAEGEGFVATPYADDEYYFRSDLRAATGTGYYKSNPIKWNIKRGMKPIKFYISKGVQNAQDALPDVDVVAALKKGVEGWNEVFGFEALRAEVVPDDGPDPGDADANFLIVDFPGVDAGYAFANWRTNPNTGEILNSTVYLDSVWFELADNFKEAATTPPTSPDGIARPETKPSVLALEWAGMRREESTPACVLFAPKYNPVYSRHLPGATRADALAIYVLKRLWLDPEDWRGYISNDPFYPGVYDLSLAQLRQLVKNADNVRSFESRRTAVDILKKFQTLEAYQGLVEAKGVLQAQVAAGTFAGGDLLKANDLLARIEQAITPYFVQ